MSRAAATSQRPRVLVVDDEASIVRLVTKTLSDEEYDLVSADSGEAALRLIDDSAAAPVDLLITDLRMPGMSGRDLAAAMRQRFPALRVLYQTGFADTLFEAAPELAPYEAFLEKPYTSDGLREAARLVMFGFIAEGTEAPDLREHGDWEDHRLRAKLVRLLRRMRLA